MKTTLLADILSFPVHTVAPDTPVREALEQMRELRISALVVVDARQRPVGIFTERDAVLLAHRHQEANAIPVARVMSAPPVSATPDLGFLPAYARMAEHKVRHLIVVDEAGLLAGIVTEGDFIRHLGFQHLVRTKDVASVMLQALTTLPEDALVREAAHLMAKQRLDCVIVEKDGQAAGILTERDLVRMSREGETGLSRTLGEAMSRPVVGISPEASLGEAIQRMDALRLRRLLVVDGRGQFIGLITHHQIASVLHPEPEPPTQVHAARATRAASPGARAWLFALLAALLVLASEQGLEHFARKGALAQEKNAVLNELSTLRARLEGVVNAHQYLVHGLAALISARPDLDRAEFDAIARNLVDERHALRNVAAAPDMVVTLMHPLADNQAAVGLDYRDHPEQREAALRARDSGRSVLTGPLPLIQGGSGIIIREPVFLAPLQPGGERRFWGLVSAVIDTETFYRKAGLRDPRPGLRLAMRGDDGAPADGPMLFGDAKVFGEQPVTLEVPLPGSVWRIAALPAAGWGQTAGGVHLMRLMGVLAALAAALLAYRLTRDNQTLRETVDKWRESQDLFERFMANLPAGAYIRDSADDRMLFQNRWLCDNLPCREASSASPAGRAMAENDRRVLIEGQLRIQETLTDANGAPLACDIQRFLIPRADGSPLVAGIVNDISARVRAEAALQESEARFVATFEQAAVGIALVSPEGQWLRVNHKLCEIVGYGETELLTRTFQDITHPDDLDSDLGQVRRMLAREIDSYTMEKRYIRKDGTVVWINLTVALVWKPEGVPDYFISVVEDIDSRKAAETALQESEARYRSLLEMAPFPAVLTRVRDGILLYGNHRAELQYGIKREDGIGQPADRFYEDPAERARFIEAIQRSGHVDDLELRMRSVDGRRFWALVSASVVEFDHEPTLFAAINDITARKEAEAALQEQETFFRLIAENMGDMVAVLDTTGRRLYNSPSYRALFGETESLRGTDSFAEIHPDDRERVRAVFAETVRTGIGHRLGFRFVLADGGVRDIESQGGVIRNAAGEVERVVVVSRDVTERKRLEDEIRQLNAELEERVRQRTAELATANKELETFTYSVSHDLKAPLRGIDGYSRLLLEDHQAQLDEEGRLFLDNVRHGVAQMSQLIEDLLTYSRMERRHLSDQTLDLPTLVAGVLEERRADIEARGMQVEVALAGLTARADPEGLVMVLRNLIDNALKFSRDSRPPILKIRGATLENATTLDIQDNGIGFDMQFHDRIFDIFQRLQRAEDYPGTGVGLAIVRKAMQRMGGRIRAESSPGTGATFHLELPR